MTLTDAEVAMFQAYMRRWFNTYQRLGLPWRSTYHPYHILVSELMLQQTQVERVIPKFTAFIKHFPSAAAVAQAPLGQILQQWQGLGYNRRAKFLHQCCHAITHQHQGVFPHTTTELQKLPGIGPYTASALIAFAYNSPTIMIETNIRTAFLYHFFPSSHKVADKEIIPLITQTLPSNDIRSWYSALMDYGSMLKKLHPNPSRKSTHATKQSVFAGSLRQVRGEIVKILAHTTHASITELHGMIRSNKTHYYPALAQLVKEGLVVRDGTIVKLE